MATFLSTFSSVTDKVSALASFAFGATGGVVLGDFAFSGFEVPEQITVPGQHMLVVHKLIGGERQINAMGDDPAPIAWSGVMLDNDPWSRAQQLEQMRADGAPLPLQWGQFYYTVLILSVQFQTLYSRVAYSISCEVLQNEATAPTDADPALTDAVSGDIGAAVVSAPLALASVMTTAQVGIAALGILVPGSPALSQASAILGQASGNLTSLSNTAGFAIGAVTDAGSLTAALANCALVAQAQQSSAYVGRALVNLS